jgi:signal peptidase I
MQPSGETLHQVRKRSAAAKYLVILALVLVPITLLKTFIVEPVKIDGTALDPGLRDGDRVLLNKHIGRISRGDVLLFGHPQRPSVRILLRVVALPGERIQLREGVLYIDGQQIPEPYVSQDHNLNKASTDEIEVANNSYFMLGDNRDEAFDSRKVGPIPRELIYAKYWMRYWPW